MKTLHFKALHVELNQDDKAAVSAIDPTRGTQARGLCLTIYVAVRNVPCFNFTVITKEV